MTREEALTWCIQNGVRAERQNGKIVLDVLPGVRVPHGLTAALGHVSDDLLARTQAARNTTNGTATNHTSIWTPKITRLSDVQPERVEWLWPGYIPLGKLTVGDGDPGLGKTTLFLDVAARVSTGRTMPDESASDLDGPAGVVILTAEDGLADTIRPRLDAAGADVSRIVALECLVNGEEERSLSLTDLSAIAMAIQSVDAKFLIIDPLMAFLSTESNSYRDQDMRRVLAPLARLAERCGVAIVVIRHLSKGGGTNAVYRGGGSIGIIGAARSGLLVATDPDDASGGRRVLAVAKSNLAAMPCALAYTLQPATNETAYVQWEGATAHTAKDLLSFPDDEERSARDEAVEILWQSLATGPRPAKEVTDVAAKAGISAKTLRTAREKLGVHVRREGGLAEEGRWVWELPPDESEDDRTPKMPTDPPKMPKMPMKNGGHLRHLSNEMGILDAAEPEDDHAICGAWLRRGTTAISGTEIAAARRLLKIGNGQFGDVAAWRPRLAEMCGVNA